MEQIKRQTVLYWAMLGLLIVLCCVLGVLQYRWIGEISLAEQDRLRSVLQSALNRLSLDFNSDVAAASGTLQPSNSEVDEKGREQAYSDRFRRWRSSRRSSELFSRIAIAIPENGTLVLRILNPDTVQFSTGEWPPAWQGLHNQLLARLNHGGPGPYLPEDANVFELPRFGKQGEQDWLICELNLQYVRNVLFPELLSRHLGSAAGIEYKSEVFVRADPSVLIYQSQADRKERIGPNADATVNLFEVRMPNGPGRMGPDGMPPDRRPPDGMRPDHREGQFRPAPPTGAEPGRGRWQLSIQSQAGSLQALVERTRLRNIGVSLMILALLVATLTLLLRFSRQAQHLAELQMNFVAGISHELRTPLTVIRTAAFNLKGKVAANPAQVQRYGGLIQEESEKLNAMIEQVLRFAGTRAGHVIRERVPVGVEAVLEDGLQSSRHALESAGCIVEKDIESGLPIVLADESALRHAIQNLIENAVRYGVGESKWIGVFARTVIRGGLPWIEIRVCDHGPGIPADEQQHIFDPFFRGKRAIQDQIHGTGLGLNLVKRIVEAHGGRIQVKSEPMNETEFIVLIPTAPPEIQHEFAHSIG